MVTAESFSISRVHLVTIVTLVGGLQEELATKEELKDIDKQIRAEVDEAAAKAREAEFPAEEELFANIYKADSGLIVYGCDRRKTKVRLP